MKRKQYLLLVVLTVVTLVGCDSDLKSENINLKLENAKLSKQVTELEFQIDKLGYQAE